MLSKDDVFQYGMSIIPGKNFDICVIDFLFLYSNISNEIKQQNRNFRDELIRRFAVRAQDDPKKIYQSCKWTIEIVYSQIIDDVIIFNENFKSLPESHTFVFVCLDNNVPNDQQVLLERSYVGSKFFQFNDHSNLIYERIFNYLEGKKSKNIVKDKLSNFCPLLLHVNSISSGLVFNYYFSYLNRQISSTNNIFIRFNFNKSINRELFPEKILVKFDTLIENIFLEKSPSTNSYDHIQSIESNLLEFKFYSISDQTVVTYSLIGVCDFGCSVEKIRIWQDKFDLNVLNTIQLLDDVREWKEEYHPCLSINRENQQTIFTFENRDDPTKICQLLPISNAPNNNDGHNGVSVMKKTTKDCYDYYISDPKNSFTTDGRRIDKILIVPVYYVIMPSSCQFGPPDTDGPSESDEITLKGTIIDPDVPNRIQLARAHGEVLRSRPMFQFNRYVRRTFYYVDEYDNNNNIIRYLFSAEYPYILSILDQLEKTNQISSIQKHDEYLRFCNMLNQLIQINNLSDSIKLIEFNDENNDYADFKPLWQQIKEHMDQYYNPLDNDRSFLLPIETRILSFEQTNHVLLFFTNIEKENELIMILIKNLRDKLEINGYIIDYAENNLNLIESKKQIIFICTGKRKDKINRLIINAIQYKINKYGVLRDIFILVNDSIKDFPCRFIRSVPYLTFDLHLRQSAHLNDDEIKEIIYYLNNMNVLSKNYTDMFQYTNNFLEQSPIQCTSVGAGCAAAFYYNYAKLLTSLPDHQLRMKLIDKQLHKENLIDLNNNKSRFISKWIFVIPWTIKDTSRLLFCSLLLDEREQQEIGFKLSAWKPEDPKSTNYNLVVTVGGVYQRSYSPLMMYKLTNLNEDKSFYFSMEIPAALHGLQTQYENVLSHFHFGRFDPLEQANIFRKKVEEFLSKDQDKTCQENIILVSLDNPHTSNQINSVNDFQQAQILLPTLWNKLNSSLS